MTKKNSTTYFTQAETITGENPKTKGDTMKDYWHLEPLVKDTNQIKRLRQELLIKQIDLQIKEFKNKLKQLKQQGVK